MRTKNNHSNFEKKLQDTEPVVKQCNNAVGELVLDCSLRNSAQPPSSLWTQNEDGHFGRVYTVDDEDVIKSFEKVSLFFKFQVVIDLLREMVQISSK